MQIFVDINASENGNGSQEYPFKMIQQAADIAQPGDYIQIMPGEYHEAVRPQYSGTSDKPIIYASAKQNQAIITGADRVTGWQPVNDNVWMIKLPNTEFGDYNPYNLLVNQTFNHAGEIFLNNKAMYEVDQLAAVMAPKENPLSRDSQFTLYTWYTEQSLEEDATIIYANFQDKDPNKEHVELTFRETCFYPEKKNIDHLILSGFTMTKAACRWATAKYNKGIIGTNTGQGWKIAKCDISHAKCSGISLGRDMVPTVDDTKTVPHRIKNNTIHDCGQTGIMGVDGNPSPIIEHNSIYNINTRQNLVSDDVSAINLSPAIGAKILRNCIHDCTRGVWLGGKVEDTQISRNVFYNNSLPKPFKVTAENQDDLIAGLGEDIEIKDSDGVTLVDNNFLLSDCALKLATKGVLLVHNLINGSVEWLSNNNVQDNDLYYHRLYQENDSKMDPYSSSCFYNNVFIRKSLRDEMAKLIAIAREQADQQENVDNHVSDDNEVFVAQSSKQRNHINTNKAGNIYLNDQVEDVTIDVDSNEDGVFIDSNICDYLDEDTSRVVAVGTTANTAMDFDIDFLGNHREGVSVTAGPFDTKDEYSHRLFRLLF
ncbi:DUF1565 domain-containing protein [Lactobacillus sp. M31]|uniref:DUF1565 domain-containing protein n=2 Tax=Limosilactobacillus walteri TaxID=2268022 RepID=A0ABR8P3M5_9LACO|nr:DUF1565 domain-containing protein [Limosilactobacillus walteri]